MLLSILDSIFIRKRESESQEWILRKREPEILRKRNLELTQRTEPKKNWKVLYLVTMSCLLGLNLLVASASMVVFLAGLYIGDAELSLNEQMITEGYAWAYDGGTKQKDFEELREIRRSYGTLTE